MGKEELERCKVQGGIGIKGLLLKGLTYTARLLKLNVISGERYDEICIRKGCERATE